MNSKGFSLIEVLIALVILSIALLGLAGLMVTTTRGNSYGSHMTEATTFAQDKLEELRASQWSAIPLGNNSDQRIGSTGINYTRSWNVAQNGSLRTITTTISWNDRTNHQISLISVIAQ